MQVGFLPQQIANPSCQHFAVLVAWLRFSLRRHLLTFKHGEHFLPRLEFCPHFIQRGKPLKVEPGLLYLCRMALHAMRHQEGADPVGKFGRGI